MFSHPTQLAAVCAKRVLGMRFCAILATNKALELLDGVDALEHRNLFPRDSERYQLADALGTTPGIGHVLW